MIVVAGYTLTGLAAAVRLARLGHTVAITGDQTPRPPLDHFELPAAWRDLATKSGRPLIGALGEFGLSLASAPPTTYLLPDGTRLILPDERGGQFVAISATLGRAQAERWRDLIDDLDEMWAALRRFGVERPAHPCSKTERRALWLHRTVADVADRAGRLAPIILAEAAFAGTDSVRAPALVAIRQVLVRTFGRHRLVDLNGKTASAEAFVSMLERRAERWGISRICKIPDEAVFLDTRPPSPRGLARRPRTALVPTAGTGETGEPAEIVDLTGNAPVRTICGQHHSTVLDYQSSTRSLAAGYAPDDAHRWLRRPAPNAHQASSACLAGGEPWAELMSAALAVYALHEELTGDDCRPTNRAFTMPRLRPR